MVEHVRVSEFMVTFILMGRRLREVELVLVGEIP